MAELGRSRIPVPTEAIGPYLEEGEQEKERERVTRRRCGRVKRNIIVRAACLGGR